MVVGKRSNHNLVGPLNTQDISRVKSSLFIAVAQDYFIMSRSLFDWSQIPSFVIGRRGYDNALVDWAYHHATLVDATATITALHQTTADGDYAGWSNKDGEYNVNLPHVVFDHGSTTDAHFRTSALSDGTIVIVNPRNSVVCYCSILQASGMKENGSSSIHLPYHCREALATKIYCDNNINNDKPF